MISLIILFLTLSGLLLYDIIISPSRRRWFKAALIAFATWYSIILFTVPDQFRGQASILDIDKMPKDLIIYSHLVFEPSKQSAGGIYLWAMDFSKEDIEAMTFDPFRFFRSFTREPKTFKLPYSKERHKKLEQAMKRKAGQKGNQVKVVRNKGGGTEVEDDVSFVIFNPYRMMTKDGNNG